MWENLLFRARYLFIPQHIMITAINHRLPRLLKTAAIICSPQNAYANILIFINETTRSDRSVFCSVNGKEFFKSAGYPSDNGRVRSASGRRRRICKKVREAGNYVISYRMKDALHGFMSLGKKYVHVRRTYELINLFLQRSGENEPIC